LAAVVKHERFGVALNDCRREVPNAGLISVAAVLAFARYNYLADCLGGASVGQRVQAVVYP
jgi:hypothetical protein